MKSIAVKRGLVQVEFLGVDVETERRGQSPYGFSRDKASFSGVLLMRIGGELVRLQPSALMFHRYQEQAVESAEIFARELVERAD